MIRGTTPTHTFNVPIDTSTIKEVRILYAQDDALVLVKETKDCELGDGIVKTTLSQDDTFMFDCKKCVEVQIRVLTEGGEALASVPVKVSVSKCLHDEVLA